MGDLPVFGARVPGCAYRRRPSVYALLQDEAGKWALVRTPHGCYLPGGGAEAGESPQQTVEREAREECGFELKTGKVLGNAVQFCYSTQEKQYFEKICQFIEAEVLEVATPTEPDHELLWADLRDALIQLTHESHRWAVLTFPGKLPCGYKLVSSHGDQKQNA